MKTLRLALTLFIAVAVLSMPLFAAPVAAQDPQNQNQATAITRGYRTGYSDGYQAGVSDVANHAAQDFRNKTEYERGDRAYNSNYGRAEEYRDGYQQGFEVGYNAGYERKPFDSSIPAELKPRTEDSTVGYPVDQNKNPGSQPPTQTQSGSPDSILRDTIMRIELLNDLSTNTSQQGDRFQAKVIEPKEYEGATVSGQVIQVKRPGKAKGTALLQLSFEEIRLPDGRSSKFSAQVIEVISNGNGQGVGKVDSEGGVQGTDSTKSDVQKVGGAAGIGAVIGAITGGGIGAAVGATIGAGVGTAGVLNQRGKDIHLYQGQQLRIRTAGDATIQ